MNVKIKLAAYVVVAILIAWFAVGFYTSYTSVTRDVAETAAAADGQTPPTPATNAIVDTNNAAANAPVAAGADTNTASTNLVAQAPAPAPAPVVVPVVHHSAHGRMIGYLAALVITFIALGLLIALDVTQYLGNVAVDTLLDVSDEAVRDPEYERAEQAWANGKHLEAIQMMREFLKAHPREQYAALRIAEIYEKDLNNLLAAALEYEEVLKKKLPAERWGWAAIHLCNLYLKINQPDKARALLQRVADEYPKTGAAKKARNRLGIAEPEPEPVPMSEPAPTRPTAASVAAEEPTPAPEAEQEAKPKLPPGFRPK